MRWCGKIGYANSSTDEYGITTEEITEVTYIGDVYKNNHRWDNNDSVNGKIRTSSQISILSDPYIIGNCQNIRYAEYMNNFWCVTDVDASQYPRLILTLGGVYNGKQAETAGVSGNSNE